MFIAVLLKTEVGFRFMPELVRRFMGFVGAFQLLILGLLAVWLSYSIAGYGAVGLWIMALVMGSLLTWYIRPVTERLLTWIGVENN